jgi:hypothetical protein
VVAAAAPRTGDVLVGAGGGGVLVGRGPLGARPGTVVDPQPGDDARHAIADVLDAPGEAAVEHHGHHVAVVPQVHELVVEVPVVGVDRGQPGLERPEHRLDVLGAVVEVLGDLVLLRGAVGEELGGHPVGPPVHLGPREAPVAVDEGLGVGHLLGHDLPHVCEVPAGHGSPWA